MKKLILDKSYLLLLISMPVLLIIAFFRKEYPADIQIEDTYYVIPLMVLNGFFAVVFGLEALVYWLLRKKELIDTVTIVHVTASIVIVLYLAFFLGAPQNAASLSNNYFNPADFQKEQERNSQTVLGLLIWIVCQFLFCMNIAVSLIRNRKK